jgi:hypothetical protein
MRRLVLTAAVIAGLAVPASAQAVGPINAQRIANTWARAQCGKGVNTCWFEYGAYPQGTGGGTWSFFGEPSGIECNILGCGIGKSRSVYVTGHISRSGRVYSTHVWHSSWS